MLSSIVAIIVVYHSKKTRKRIYVDLFQTVCGVREKDVTFFKLLDRLIPLPLYILFIKRFVHKHSYQGCAWNEISPSLWDKHCFNAFIYYPFLQWMMFSDDKSEYKYYELS